MRAAVLLILLAAFSLLPGRADNALQNGDFADGAAHWRGDGRTPADITAQATDPFAKPDAFLSKGLIIPLKPHQWTKITQDFRTRSTDLSLTINCLFSDGLAFSQKPEDYVNVPKQIDNLLYLSFDILPGQVMLQFTDFGNGARGMHYEFSPRFGTTEVQTLRAQVNGVSKLEDEVMTIAFPPGHGNVVLQSVTLE